MSVRQIAASLDRSTATPRHWLTRHGLRTLAAQRVRRGGSTTPEVVRDCPRHGWTRFRRVGAQTHHRCAQCVTEAVTERRRRIEQILVEEAGGRCVIGGYAESVAALRFHHLDPATRAFSIRYAGTRALDRIRAEAKCALLCANCHAEVESGSTQVPVPSQGRDPFRGGPEKRSGVAQSAERTAVNR
jgi:hypothetical protein